jgi:hypothetical protein
MTRLFTFLSLLLVFADMSAGNLDDIKKALEQSGSTQVQEKVYIHTDNECYFVGDTLWYKAYVVRADRLVPTDMSRILYVELLSPDGLLVERQHIIISPTGHTCGQFVLTDSLYSGYYELRAYTRWMLNFNVGHQRYSKQDTWYFYNKEMAADFFRSWDGLYSRVFPVYSKSDQPGDYDVRRMYQRPKQDIPQPKKDKLLLTFYPEGGHLIAGVENRVAFEAVDQYGEAVSIKGEIWDNDGQPQSIQTEYMGRGVFTITPSDKKMEARFTFRDKKYDFDLPRAEQQGVAVRLDGSQLHIDAKNLPSDKAYAVSILCRGALKYFDVHRSMFTVHRSPFNVHRSTFNVPIDSLPTGVNELTLFDSDGRIWASRLFFVNHHDYDDAVINYELRMTDDENKLGIRNSEFRNIPTLQPYERVELPVVCQGVTAPTTFSLAIRDTNTDEPTYNNGNLMTDMLLSSDLRGFIANPAYYFEADDETHRRHLDMLMMVQGWRKYKWSELTDTTRTLRYQPEKTLTVEGMVCKMLDVTEVQPDEVTSWQDGLVAGNTNIEFDEDGIQTTTTEYTDMNRANENVGINNKGVRREVLVEAEITVGTPTGGTQSAGSTQRTQNGRFMFQIPPFYGLGYLNMKAYSPSDSIKKNMASRRDAKVYDEKSYPDYFVKRDVFFPMTTQPYNYYQNHMPDIDTDMLIDTLSTFSMENDVHQLANLNVKGHRRGRRAIDWKKPAYVQDAYDLYNELTDRGLSFGYFDMRQFPLQVCRYLFGNMGRHRRYNIDGRLEHYTYWRNYSPVSSGASEAEMEGLYRAHRTSQYLYNQLLLSRLQDIRVFSDYEPRNPDSTMVERELSADATVQMVPIPNDGRQVVYRDRHIVFQGFNEPEDFYHPDYSQRPADSHPADYRRTLYWNPNAVTDEQGRFTATFYNNGKETRICVSAAGVTPDGRLLYAK